MWAASTCIWGRISMRSTLQKRLTFKLTLCGKSEQNWTFQNVRWEFAMSAWSYWWTLPHILCEQVVIAVCTNWSSRQLRNQKFKTIGDTGQDVSVVEIPMMIHEVSHRCITKTWPSQLGKIPIPRQAMLSSDWHQYCCVHCSTGNHTSVFPTFRGD